MKEAGDRETTNYHVEMPAINLFIAIYMYFFYLSTGKRILYGDTFQELTKPTHLHKSDEGWGPSCLPAPAACRPDASSPVALSCSRQRGHLPPGLMTPSSGWQGSLGCRPHGQAHGVETGDIISKEA